MFSYKIILIGLIDSFTDYWSNINATDSVERYRSMSATYWSRWHLLVCTSKYSYISIKQKLKAFQKIVFLVFIHNLSTNFIRVWAKLFYFLFLFFSFVFFIQFYIYDIVLNFSLFYLCQKIQQRYNASVLNRMMFIFSENWESLFDLAAISLELFVPSLKQTLRDVHDCLRDKEQEMIGSKAMRRKNQDMVSNCLVRVSNFQYTQVTTPSIQNFLESERLIM